MVRGKKPAAITARLWEQLEAGEGCWIWKGARSPLGYGIIGTGKRGRTMLVHRLVWMLFRGDPGSFHVLHHCDTPECSNPDHLFLGTQADNMRDMDAKRRCVRIGERRRKLTPEQVYEVLNSPESSHQLAKRLPISARSIRNLRAKGGYTGITWNPWDGRP